MTEETPEPVGRPAELIGATGEPLRLGGESTQVAIALHEPTGPGREGAPVRLGWTPPRVFLNVENITSDVPSPPYEVYLNLPVGADPERHPEHHAGTLALFGISSVSRGPKHPQHGLLEKLDVTALYALLCADRSWDRRTLRVVFVPTARGAPPIRVGRVSLYLA